MQIYLNKDLESIVVRGAITDRFIENLIANRNNFNDIR